jgi:hypothetical protein
MTYRCQHQPKWRCPTNHDGAISPDELQRATMDRMQALHREAVKTPEKKEDKK